MISNNSRQKIILDFAIFDHLDKSFWKLSDIRGHDSFNWNMALRSKAVRPSLALLHKITRFVATSDAATIEGLQTVTNKRNVNVKNWIDLFTRVNAFLVTIWGSDAQLCCGNRADTNTSSDEHSLILFSEHIAYSLSIDDCNWSKYFHSSSRIWLDLNIVKYDDDYDNIVLTTNAYHKCI